MSNRNEAQQPPPLYVSDVHLYAVFILPSYFYLILSFIPSFLSFSSYLLPIRLVLTSSFPPCSLSLSFLCSLSLSISFSLSVSACGSNSGPCFRRIMVNWRPAFDGQLEVRLVYTALSRIKQTQTSNFCKKYFQTKCVFFGHFRSLDFKDVDLTPTLPFDIYFCFVSAERLSGTSWQDLFLSAEWEGYWSLLIWKVPLGCEGMEQRVEEDVSESLLGSVFGSILKDFWQFWGVRPYQTTSHKNRTFFVFLSFRFFGRFRVS